MEWFIKAFIRTSLLWLAAAVVLGVAMAVYPPWIVYRPAHAHLSVVGFLTMLVFGVGYQLLPRLFGHPLHSPRLAVAHLYLANVGLAGLVVGFVVRPYAMVDSRWLTAFGGGPFCARRAALDLEPLAYLRCGRGQAARASAERSATAADRLG